MADIPIIFSGPMIRALLDGRKTTTRRMLYSLRKAQNGIIPASATVHRDHPPPRGMLPLGQYWTLSGWQNVKPGDRLWVREEWRVASRHDGTPPRDLAVGTQPIWLQWYLHETPTKRLVSATAGHDLDGSHQRGKRRASFHMPRWASRLTLVVTATKIERLQAISESDAEAEGVFRHVAEYSLDKVFRDERGATAIRYFRELWESLHGPDAWAANPEVVAISFVVHQANIDRLGKEAA